MTDSSQQIELLRFTTAGSVDDGKSTLIGRLLYDSKSIFEDQMDAVEKASRSRGDAGVDLALLTDGLRAEREQKITIDVAYRYFATPKRKFIIADTPGHIQYTRNMVTGASTAELAIILIDARHGVLTQSKRHGFLAALLRIPHLMVAVNKMDLVDYDQHVYNDIVQAYSDFARKLNVQGVTYIPVSALWGDNVVDKSENMPWYAGPTLLHHLENVNVGASLNNVDFRYPVQYVLRPNQNFRGYAGQVASGRVAQGDEVVVLPSGLSSKVESIVTTAGNLDAAKVGDSVVLTLADDIDISRGDMIVRKQNLPQKSNRVDATICWMGEEPMRAHGQYRVQHTTRLVNGFISGLNYKIDVDTMHREPADTLTLNEIGRIQLTTTQPLFYDRYQLNRMTGSFILIDPNTNNTVAAGMIRGRSRDVEELLAGEVDAVLERSKSSNVVWEQEGISLATREERNGHKAAVLWFTGLSGSGKSTIAKKLDQRLFANNVRTMFLDGDNLRHGLNGDLGFSSADRQENIRRAAEVAKLSFAHGDITLACFISPFAADRCFARQLVPNGRFIEIYVKCDLDVVKRRDTKGLYARAMAGEIDNFTGISSPYEEPENAELVVETDIHTVDELVEQIILDLRQRGILPHE
ncbi:MAG: bifunctional sulfate adenylyltransferase subunit 1/adenylylsulfate kinase [Chloroflexi bacterium]|nr:MAG: bifunctional sulfate adenylyltransferase subunit 1/adenylylsulfate kinase [Chloroflexota bacterium]PIE81563.1 MAG: bifunctional sulfate adenylyltransferase subunit 1/adenylylsulfate kinase [Chloroflexota bacterium]